MLAAVLLLVAVAVSGAAYLRHAWASSALDGRLYVVMPFEDRVEGDVLDQAGARSEEFLYDAITRWEGLSVVSDLRVADALAREGAPRTLAERRALAREFGARHLIWGTVRQHFDSLVVRAVLYDVRDGDVVREEDIRLGRGARDEIPDRFSELAAAVLFGRTAPQRDAILETRNFEALEAYFAGVRALGQWDLEAARQHFLAATAADTALASAHLALAEVSLWAGDSAPQRRETARRAVALSAKLGERDRTVAAAMLDLADGRFPEACARFDSLIVRDSSDFEAWYGRGECQEFDLTVVRDPRSPSGWSFRGSRHAAMQSYLRALEIVPSFHAALRGKAFERLKGLFAIEARRLRRGQRPGDTTIFTAYPALDHDTIAFVPWPRSEIGKRGRLPRTAIDAVDLGRRQFRQTAERWARSFPSNPHAAEAHAEALEAVGLLAPVGGGGGGALAEVRRALSLSTDSLQRARLGASHVRILAKLGNAAQARAVADSLLEEHVDPAPDVARVLAPVAALRGKIARTVDLVERAAPVRPSGFGPDASTELVAAHQVLLLHASLGEATPGLTAALQAFDRLVGPAPARSRRAALRATMMQEPARWALERLPRNAASDVLADTTHSDIVLTIRDAIRQRDYLIARAELGVRAAQRASVRASDYAIQSALIESELFAMAGDTATAAAVLDATLGVLPSMTSMRFEEPVEAIALVRAMALRAELAHARGNPALARRWAALALTYWTGGDPETAPAVARLRRIVR